MELLNVFIWISFCSLATSISPLNLEILSPNQVLPNGQLVYWNGCSSQINRCNLSCVFYYDTTSDVEFYWTDNDGRELDSTSQELLVQLSLSYVTVDTTIANNYTCISVINNETATNHTFIIDGQQSLPSFDEEVTFEITGSGNNNCSVSFSCLVNGNPQPIVQWMKYGVDNNENPFGLEVFNSTLFTVEDKHTYSYQLDVPQYDSSIKWHFSCLAINNVGFNLSHSAVPYISPGQPQLDQNALPMDYPSDAQKLVCTSSGGFPAPLMSWEILVNDSSTDIDYEVNYKPSDNGKSILELTIPSTNLSLGMTITCNESSSYSNFEASNTATVINSETAAIVSVKNCSPDDFTSSNKCTLACTVYSQYDVKAEWYYKSLADFPLKLSYNLVDGISTFSPDTYYYKTKLTLSNYYSGYYMCVIDNGYQQLNNSFHISTITGQYLNEPCYSDQNCLALYSKCDSHRCQCIGDTPVPVINSELASACVVNLPETPLVSSCEPSQNFSCVYDNQCNYNYPISDAFICDPSGYCKCRGTCAYVSEVHDDMCITKKTYGETCIYDEQCDFTLYCTTNKFCGCETGYYFSYSLKQCYNPYGRYWSMSAAMGIAFGIIVLICMIFAFIVFLAKSRSTRRSGLNHRNVTGNGNRPNHRQMGEFETVDLDMNIISFPIENPPSYGDIRRCETPPPTFEDTIQIKPELSGAIYLVNDNYTGDDSHTQPTDHEHGITNTAYENDAPL